METNETDISLRSLPEKFKSDLIVALNAKGHNKSGKLSSSISFSLKKEGDKTLIELYCMEYIKYLEKGNFLKNFLEKKQKEIKEVLTKAAKKDILNFLKQK